MSRIFVSQGTGATVYVFSNDHCPAHVHARHRGDGWIARVSFSYLTSAIELISIAPAKSVPSRRVVNSLMSDVQERLSDCRRSWWVNMRTTCLVNQWAIVTAPGKIELVSDRAPSARQIVDANYDPESERLRVEFQRGAKEEVEL